MYPDTKEKPFICHCGAAFTRRDLLTRHHRITLHGDESKADTPQCAGILDQESETRISPRRTRDRGTANFEPPVPPALRSRSGGTGEADLDAAGSFSGLSVDPWVVGHGSLPNTDNGTSASQQGRRNTYVDVRSHGQGVLSPQLMDSSPFFLVMAQLDSKSLTKTRLSTRCALQRIRQFPRWSRSSFRMEPVLQWP